MINVVELVAYAIVDGKMIGFLTEQAVDEWLESKEGWSKFAWSPGFSPAIIREAKRCEACSTRLESQWCPRCKDWRR